MAATARPTQLSTVRKVRRLLQEQNRVFYFKTMLFFLRVLTIICNPRLVVLGYENDQRARRTIRPTTKRKHRRNTTNRPALLPPPPTLPTTPATTPSNQTAPLLSNKLLSNRMAPLRTAWKRRKRVPRRRLSTRLVCRRSSLVSVIVWKRRDNVNCRKRH